MTKVLVAEDDAALNALITQYLNAGGYEAISAADGADALKKYVEERPEIIVSDIMMPGLDGFSLAKKAREIDNSIPILFTSARDDKPSQQLGFKLGIDDYDRIIDNLNMMAGELEKTDTGEGNGLGLALVKKVIDILGGDITVESKIGEGSVFTVTIAKCAQ